MGFDSGRTRSFTSEIGIILQAMDIGRPGRDETIDYYHPYVDIVPDGDVVAILEEQQRGELAFLEALPESLGAHRYEPGKWSVNEILGHLADCERLYTFRAFWFARGLPEPLPSFEPELALQTSKVDERPLHALTGELSAIRAATVHLFRNMPEEAWLRRGTASGSAFSVRGLAYIAAGHLIHHVRILRERYL
jgi:hypothetical protein